MPQLKWKASSKPPRADKATLEERVACSVSNVLNDVSMISQFLNDFARCGKMFQLAVCQKWIKMVKTSLGHPLVKTISWCHHQAASQVDAGTLGLDASPRISTYLDPFSGRKSLNEGPSHGGAARERSAPYHSRNDSDGCDGCDDSDGRDSRVMMCNVSFSHFKKGDTRRRPRVFHVPQLFLPHSNGFSFVLVCSIQMSHGR